MGFKSGRGIRAKESLGFFNEDEDVEKGKGKNCFIKHNITYYVDTVC